MRRLCVDATLAPSTLLEALREPEPLELTLVAAPPALDRVDLLRTAARRSEPLLVRFDGVLATPLAELALLSLGATFGEGAALDLDGALLTPLVRRIGVAAARRLLVRHGTRLPAAAVLDPAGEPGARSPFALGLAAARLESAGAGARAAYAGERAVFALAMAAPDRREGIRAFRERRDSRFDW